MQGAGEKGFPAVVLHWKMTIFTCAIKLFLCFHFWGYCYFETMGSSHFPSCHRCQIPWTLCFAFAGQLSHQPCSPVARCCPSCKRTGTDSDRVWPTCTGPNTSYCSKGIIVIARDSKCPFTSYLSRGICICFILVFLLMNWNTCTTIFSQVQFS